MRKISAESEGAPRVRDDAWSVTAGGAVVAPPPRATAGWAAWSGRVAAASAVVGGAAILVILVLVAGGAAVRSPALAATADTALGCTALAAAWLMRVRFQALHRLGDLLILAAVSTLALLTLCEAVLPAALGPEYGRHLEAARLWGELSLGAAFAAAAFAAANRHVARPRRLAAAAAAVPVAAAGAAVLAGLTLGPASIDAGRAGMGRVGHPLGLAVALVAAGVLAAAAIRMAAAERHAAPDQARGLLPISLALLAAAAGLQIIVGMPAANEVSISDLPRFLAIALLLVSAARDEPLARARAARAAALAERRRVARDLHDGLAQDLAFIATYGPALAEELGQDHPVVVAAQRALAISRGAISELADPAGATARESLEAVAQELRERFDVAVAVDVALQSDLEPQAREHVTRIVREAIANAVRHGGARNVSVSLRPLELAIVLRVVDDGRGLGGEAGAAAEEGFGFGSMRERAAALGGYLSVHQPRHGGTEVEVVFR